MYFLVQVFSSKCANIYFYHLDRNARKECTEMDHQLRGRYNDLNSFILCTTLFFRDLFAALILNENHKMSCFVPTVRIIHWWYMKRLMVNCYVQNWNLWHYLAWLSMSLIYTNQGYRSNLLCQWCVSLSPWFTETLLSPILLLLLHNSKTLMS